MNNLLNVTWQDEREQPSNMEMALTLLGSPAGWLTFETQGQHSPASKLKKLRRLRGT